MYFYVLFKLFPTSIFCFFFFNDTATTEIYTLSLHDALPIFEAGVAGELQPHVAGEAVQLVAAVLRQRAREEDVGEDRKSTRLNSSHTVISYAVFCLKKKKKKKSKGHTNTIKVQKKKQRKVIE